MGIAVHIIDNLKRGGAETLLLEVVRSLKGYDHHIIALTSEREFSKEELAGMQIHSMGFRSAASYPTVLLRLRKMLRSLNPNLIHAHLPLASFMARLCRPANVPLFVSVHNKYSDSLKAVSRKMFFFEKALHSKNEELIFVSGAIKDDYEQIIGIRGRHHVLYNFIADKFFQAPKQLSNHGSRPYPLKLVSVGSFKYQKNFDTLLKAFALLEPDAFSLDIYGDGPERSTLEQLINFHHLKNVRLMGAVANVEQRLPHYDAFILASRYEGFGLAPLEAAALNIPLLLSEITVFKEVTQGLAVFFDADNADDIANKIRIVSENYQLATKTAQNLRPIVEEQYALAGYLKRLENIYRRAAQ